jgi:hypothetical protein
MSSPSIAPTAESEANDFLERRNLRINECNNLFQSHAEIISLRSHAAPSQRVFSRPPHG